MAWEVVEALEMFDIPVVSITGDGAKSNRRFYKMCQKSNKRSSVPYKSINPFQKDRDIFFFSDVPHLLKTARNCFSNSFAHSCSRKMQVNNTIIIAIDLTESERHLLAYKNMWSH